MGMAEMVDEVEARLSAHVNALLFSQHVMALAGAAAAAAEFRRALRPSGAARRMGAGRGEEDGA
jgi:hypothetical protein